MAILVGVVAEDQSDVDVVGELLAKIARKKYVIKKFVGRGSGRIVGKCGAWARLLSDQGCTRLIVVQDLDMAHLDDLRAQLAACLNGCPIAKRIVVIPVREIEAWLLADEAAIAKIAKPHRSPKAIANPERIMRPKEFLRDLISRLSERRIVYINTIHNKQIAKHASLHGLARCASFRPLEGFAVSNFR